MEVQPVREDTFLLSSSTNRQFFVSSFLPASGKFKGIVLIIPGMAEHSGRYKEFAFFLVEKDYGVYACDHPRQQLNPADAEEPGRKIRYRGWQIMLENVRAMYTFVRKNHPEIPVFVFGHSMGSILARHFTALYPVYIQGLALSGSFMISFLSLSVFLNFIRLKILFEGSDKKSKWFNKLFYWNFNRHFKDRPTLFEWISSDREEVDSYVADPGCGYDCSNGFYRHLLKGIAATKRAEKLITYRKSLPVLILSGQADPVGRFGKDAVRLHKEYFEQNFKNLSLKIFPGRHELLHEKNKDDVYRYLLKWLNESLEVK